MSPIATGRTLVVGEMLSLAGIVAATSLIDVTWPPGVDVLRPSLVNGSGALSDVVAWTPCVGAWFLLAVGASAALDVGGKWP